jgi:hypothetical protein
MKNQSMSAAIAAAASMSSKPKDPDATDYHAIFPINDYPQKARWKATNKEQMTLLSEISGASITMRGVYYPPGEDPPLAGEPKLHLLIESNDENKVRAAVEEIRRNLVEASVLALNVSHQLSDEVFVLELITRMPIGEVQREADTLSRGLSHSMSLPICNCYLPTASLRSLLREHHWMVIPFLSLGMITFRQTSLTSIQLALFKWSGQKSKTDE